MVTLLTSSPTYVHDDFSPKSRPPVSNDLYDLAMAHPALFIDHFCLINDPNTPERGPFRFRLWPWQWELLDHFINHKRVVVLKARQMGVSWLLAAYALWTFLSKPGSNIIFISKREEDAAKLLAKAVFIYRNLPERFKFTVHKRDSDTRLAFRSENLNSTMSALAAVKGAGRSETATLVIPDEWAFQEYAEEMYGGYEPTVGMYGEIKGCSTANGPQGLFYAIYQAAKLQKNNFFAAFLSWNLRPGRTQEWRDAKTEEFRLAGTPELAAQEYPSDDLEAFSASRNMFFPLELQRQLLATLKEPLEIRWNETSSPLIGWRIYQRPATYHRYILGADVALGVTGGDYSTISVIDRGTGLLVSTVRLHLPPDLFAAKVYEVAQLYNDATVAVEANNHGLATLNVLEFQLRYKNLYRQPSRTLKPSPNTPLQRAGWLTTKSNKPDMLFNLRTALSDGSLTSLDLWLSQEVQYFEQDGIPPGPVKYQALPGYNDDMIMATGIAWAIRGSAGPGRRGSRSMGPLSR